MSDINPNEHANPPQGPNLPEDPQAQAAERERKRAAFQAAMQQLNQAVEDPEAGSSGEAPTPSPQGAGDGEPKRNILLDTFFGTVRGPIEALNESVKTAQALDDWFVNLPGIRNVKAGVDRITPGFIRRLDEENKEFLRDTGAIENIVPEAERGLGMFAEGITQFATDFVLWGKVFRGANLLQQGAGKVANAFARGAIVDATAFDPFEGRLSNILTEVGPEATRAAAEWFAADPDDNQGEARLKAAMEGALLGGVLDGVLLSFRAMKKLAHVRNGGVKDADAERLVQEAVDEIDQADELIRRGDPDDPIQIREDEDGKFRVLNQETGETLPGRDFDTRGAAEAQAATVRMAVREAGRIADEGLGLTTEQVGQVKAIADVLRDSGDADEVLARATDGTLNLGYSHTPESAKRQIVAIAEAIPKSFEKIPQTNETTLAFAKDLLAGSSETEVASILGATFDAVDNLPQVMVASRIWLWNQGRQVAKLSRLVDMSPGDDIAAAELEKGLRSLFEVQSTHFGMARKVGQALQSQQIAVSGLEAAPRKGPRRGLKVLSQKGSEGISEVFEGMSSADIRAMARRIRMADGDPNQILTMVEASKRMQAAARQKKPGWMEKIVEWRINSMLAGVATHVINTTSTAANTLARPAEMAWAGLHLRNPELRRKALQEAGDTFIGLTHSMRDSFVAARKALQLGENILDPGHMIDDRGRASHAIGGWLGTVIRAPTRLMLSTDEFFKQLNYRAQVRAKSLQLSRIDGIVDPRQIGERLDADMRAAFNPDGTATLAPAREYAREITFTNTLTGPVGKALTDAAGKMPAIRIVLPFIRTPMNLFRYTWERTPVLNLAMKKVREDIAAGGQRRALALARMEFGAVAYAAGGIAFANGMITGRAPRDPDLRNVWMQTHQPYSVRIGNRWVSYRRMDPFATPIGLIADGIQFTQEMGADSKLNAGEVAATVIGAITSNVASKTFLRTTVETLEALTSGDPHKLERIFKIQARPMFPFSALTGGLNREADPIFRETRTWMDDFVRQHVPGMSDQIEPLRNFFGEKVMRGPFMGRAVNPFTVSRAIPAEEEEKVMQLLELGKGIPLPQTTRAQGRIDLTDRRKWSADGELGQSPYDFMMEQMTKPLLNGKTARDAVFEFIGSDTWNQLSAGTSLRGTGGTRHMFVSKLLDAYQQMAWVQTLEKYPALRQAVFEEQALERAAQVEGEAGVERIKNLNLFESLNQ